MIDNVLFIYPGQPFIEDGIVTALLAFSKAPGDDNLTLFENVCASRSVVATMIAVESVKNHALHNHHKPEGKTLGKTLDSILDDKSNYTQGLTLWDELRILRNGLVHTSLFFDSTTKSNISEATQHRLEIEINRGKIDKEDHKTRNWKLAVNPLRVSRYEDLVALTFFYWLGRSTGVWKTGTPFGAAFVDRRLKDVFEFGLMTEKKYNQILTRSGNMEHFLGYLAHHLHEKKKRCYFKMSDPLFNVSLEAYVKTAIGINSLD